MLHSPINREGLRVTKRMSRFQCQLSGDQRNDMLVVADIVAVKNFTAIDFQSTFPSFQASSLTCNESAYVYEDYAGHEGVYGLSFSRRK